MKTRKTNRAASKQVSVLGPVHHAWQCLPSLGLSYLELCQLWNLNYFWTCDFLPYHSRSSISFLHGVLAPFIFPQLSQPPRAFPVYLPNIPELIMNNFLCICFFTFPYVSLPKLQLWHFSNPAPIYFLIKLSIFGAVKTKKLTRPVMH